MWLTKNDKEDVWGYPIHDFKQHSKTSTFEKTYRQIIKHFVDAGLDHSRGLHCTLPLATCGCAIQIQDDTSCRGGGFLSRHWRSNCYGAFDLTERIWLSLIWHFALQVSFTLSQKPRLACKLIWHSLIHLSQILRLDATVFLAQCKKNTNQSHMLCSTCFELEQHWPMLNNNLKERSCVWTCITHWLQRFLPPHYFIMLTENLRSLFILLFQTDCSQMMHEMIIMCNVVRGCQYAHET